MKIGILTFHNALNFGASLQAYALCKAISVFDDSVEVINYINPKMRREIKLFYAPKNESISSKLIRWFYLPRRFRSKLKFNAFDRRHMKLSGKIISDEPALRALEPHYRKLVVGSDQIFNYNGTGNDFHFYLDFCSDSNKKIAYAPSFGVSQIADEKRDVVAKLLNDFYALSAREQAGVDIIKDLTGREAQLVCDPTFLLTADDWRQIAKPVKIRQPYVLVYAFGSKHLAEKARKLADTFGGIVVDINRYLYNPLNPKEKNITGISPAEFIWLIDHARYVVTNSYHGMALSINLQKDFFLFENNYLMRENNTNLRFYTLANQLELHDRVLTLEQDCNPNPVDYTLVSQKLDAWRQQSLQYLKSALTN